MLLSTMFTRMGLAVATALVVAGTSSQALALSGADLITFPISEVSYEVDLSDPDQVEGLSQGETYDFSVSRIGVYDPSGNNPDVNDPSTWTILRYEATFTYLGDMTDTEILLVMTSLRQGEYVEGDPLPDRIDAGFVIPSIEDDGFFYAFDPMLAEHGSEGTIVDDEGAYFLAFSMQALPGVQQTFIYDIAVRETMFATLNHFNRAYIVPSATPVPEPAGLMAGATLALGLLFLRRRR